MPELKCFEVGDRILEVDGSPVKEESLTQIMDLLNNHATPLHVMLERDQSPIRLPTSQPNTESISSSSHSSPPDGETPKTVIVHNTPVKLRPKATLRARDLSPSRRRSKSPSPCPINRHKSMDLSRSHSFSSHKQDHRVFRATDLIEGEVLGQGFFGKAIKAKHRITGEQMVLKELHNFDEDAQRGFLREVSMLRNLSHPCVLKFMGVLYRDKKLTLVTEYIDGGTLSTLLLDMEMEFSWLQRLKMVKDIADGMNYLHSMDIIHRDLNSHNCFVRQDQSVVVADFGLAKIVPRHEFGKLSDIQENNKKTVSGKGRRFNRKKRQTVVGNPYWMAPEMFLTSGIYDEKVDVFSYGIIVCETIARVPADPDYMPRSIDFGMNVEAFYSRFCQNAPEAYVLLGALCSHIEPDKRPSFERIHVFCETLNLHLEHGMAVPQELQGSAVTFYRSEKERIYGRGYKDMDSVEQAEVKRKQEVEKENKEEVVATIDSVTPSVEKVTATNTFQILSQESKGENNPHVNVVSVCNSNDIKISDFTPMSTSSSGFPGDSPKSNESKTEINTVENVTSIERKDSNESGHIEKSFTELNLNNMKANSSFSGSGGAANEDFAYFSSSSLSQSPSVSSLSLCAEDFNPCKMSPVSSSENASNFDKVIGEGRSNFVSDSCQDLNSFSLDVPSKTMSTSISDSTISNLLISNTANDSEDVSLIASDDSQKTASSSSSIWYVQMPTDTDIGGCNHSGFPNNTNRAQNSHDSFPQGHFSQSTSHICQLSPFATLSSPPSLSSSPISTPSTSKFVPSQITNSQKSSISVKTQNEGSSLSISMPRSKSMPMNDSSDKSLSVSPINNSHMSSSRRRKNKLKNLAI